jgi:hypothetical protein
MTDRGIIEGRETPEDDIYILTPNGGVVWADNAIDAEKAEEEIRRNGNTESNDTD